MQITVEDLEEIEALERARPSAQQTLEYLVKRSGRAHVPLSRGFLQRGRARTPGPFSSFVTQRQPRALDTYLLLHGVASSDPWDITLPALVYGRALGLPETSNTETSIRKALIFIKNAKLITIEPNGRYRQAVLLRDDGSGKPYRGVEQRGRGYFRVPWEYFTDGWNQQLSLPGKAVLVLALAQASPFTLPAEQAAGWYGISADTIQRGLRQLRDLGLLKVWQTYKTAPAARFGVTKVNHYALTGAFARKASEVEVEI